MMVVPINKGLRFTAEDAINIVHGIHKLRPGLSSIDPERVLDERPSEYIEQMKALQSLGNPGKVAEVLMEMINFLYIHDEKRVFAYCFGCNTVTECKEQALESSPHMLCDSCKAPLYLSTICEVLGIHIAGTEPRKLADSEFKNFQDFMSWIEKRKENAMTEDISKKCPLCGNEKHPDAEYCDDCEVKVDRNINDPKR